jgi:hypothetical protein
VPTPPPHKSTPQPGRVAPRIAIRRRPQTHASRRAGGYAPTDRRSPPIRGQARIRDRTIHARGPRPAYTSTFYALGNSVAPVPHLGASRLPLPTPLPPPLRHPDTPAVRQSDSQSRTPHSGRPALRTPAASPALRTPAVPHSALRPSRTPHSGSQSRTPAVPHSGNPAIRQFGSSAFHTPALRHSGTQALRHLERPHVDAPAARNARFSQDA